MLLVQLGLLVWRGYGALGGGLGGGRVGILHVRLGVVVGVVRLLILRVLHHEGGLGRLGSSSRGEFADGRVLRSTASDAALACAAAVSCIEELVIGASDRRRSGRGAAIGGRGIAGNGAWRLGWRDGDRGSAVSGEGMVLAVVSAWSGRSNQAGRGEKRGSRTCCGRDEAKASVIFDWRADRS